MKKQKILITDDEKPIRDVMARLLGTKYECFTASDAESSLKVLAAHPDIALLITDYKMPGENGIELIKKAKALYKNLAAIVITAFGEIDLAVKAMQEGADDFITKPILDFDRLEFRVAKAIKAPADDDESENSKDGFDLEEFTGRSETMKKVYALIRKAAASNANVLIEGPSGTGKELAARALHNLSPRAKGPFVAVECAALSSTLLESELFGHEKGAFTDAIRQKQGRFEAANGGTLFLDEITEIDLSTQVKLLRVLQERSFQRVGGTEEIKTDFRLVAATNRNLADYVAQGKFREDLYYRLDVIDIVLPPLAARPGDIALLAKRFMREFAKENASSVKSISKDALEALERYNWPGNVRQLRNVIEKMVVLASGEELTLDDVPKDIVSPAQTVQAASSNVQSLEDTEKTSILKALEITGGNKSKAARMLGISRRTLLRRLEEWGME